MATPNVGILTTAGKALIDKVNSGQAKISFSKIVFSSMDNSQLSDMQVKALTAIAPQEVVVSSPETTLDTNSGETRIRATGTNEKLADGVYVKTYGVFAKDDTGSEILYGVTVSPNPNYFPAYDGVTPQAVTYSYKTVIQETSNITMTNSNDVYASQEDLTEAIAAIPLATKADDSKAVHNSGNEEIGGQKTFDVAPIDKTTGNPYITKSDLNNGLSTKVTDNKNGTEQINGVQVQPFNKLSDTIGGRNYLVNTQNPSATNPVKIVGTSSIDATRTVTFSNGYVKLSSVVSSTASETYYRFYAPNPTSMPLPAGTYTLVVDLTSSDNVYVSPIGQFSTNGNTWQPLSNPKWKLSSTEQRFYYTFTIPSNATGWFISLEMYADTPWILDNTGKSFQFRNVSIQKGDIATDSSPAPEDKVNVTDMRKPASDVAGIDEVSTLQAQVDNSAVGTNLAIGTGQEYVMGFGTPNTVWQDGYAYLKLPLNTNVGEILPQGSHTFSYTLTKGTTYTQTVWLETDAKLINGSGVQFTWYTSAGHDHQPATLINLDENKYKVYSTYTWPGKSDNNLRVFDIYSLNSAFDLSTGTYLKFGKLKLEKGGLSTDWCPNPEDKVNVADMRKPANDVAGIEEVNAKQDKIGYTPADDSKVAHLSGSNNFDTVPTVNNNPLLLASSLPSDLARLSQDANFTAKLQQNGQDVALANNTIARNPDTGVVSEPTDFTNLTVNGGKSVATRDDLNNFYHANTSEDAALVAAKAATVPGIYWYEED